MDNNYSVYMHVFPNGKRYIGITCRPLKKRWASGTGYKGQFVYRAILKYGWNNIIHNVLYINLSKSEAERIEVSLIKKYDTTNRDNGYNIENGGSSSERLTPELRNRISKKLKGRPKGMENIKKYKAVWNARPEEEKERLKNVRSKKVLQFSLNGEFIASYKSTREVSMINNISCSHISECCNNKRKTIGGYIWKYAA